MSNVTITNSDGEKIKTEVPELPEGITTSGYITPIDLAASSVLTDLYNETLDNSSKITEAVTEKIEEKIQQPQFHNRAERRAFAKKLGKTGRTQFGTISETAKKLNYINLIQQLRELNEKKENENYEQATEN